LISVIFLSSGILTHLIATSEYYLFSLNRLYSSPFLKENYLYNLGVLPICFPIRLIMYLPKNKPVSLLELLPYKGVQYTRSTGTKSSILKMDLRIHTALIRLPSGVKKFFSTYSLGSNGSIALPIYKNFQNNKAGFYQVQGKKSTVRGVAMNPVDHPHGGRNKAIKYQRTP
jgi:ribosomal protein L2